MKARIFAFLVLLNVVLICGGFYFFNGKISSVAPAQISQLRDKSKFSAGKSTKREPSLPPKIVYVTNQFNWREVESSDYRKYIANLRGVGCPESTIKDIILTDIMKLYAARRGQFFTNGREFKFWETDEKRKLTAKQLEEREKQLASIDKEIPAVLRDLLGINYEREINKYFVDTNEEDRRLSFLNDDKKNAVLALRDQFEGMKERVLDEANGNLSATDTEALRKIEQQRNQELAKILSGSELAEFELRMSPVADQLRDQLIGFNPSEAEFRQIFELEKSVDEKFSFTKPNDENALREKAAAQEDVQTELKRELGETRYAEYQRAQNPDFREARIFTEVYELPVSTAQTIFDIKQIAENERQYLLKDYSVPEPQRLEALKAIQMETEKSLRQTMGTKVYASYAQGTGSWIQKLGSDK
jgi:hypothetical protein